MGGSPAPPLLDAFGWFVNAHGDDKAHASVLVSEYLAGPTRATTIDGAAMLDVAAGGHRRPQIVEADLALRALGQAVGLLYEGTPADQALGEAARTLRALLDEPDEESGGEDEGDGG